MKLKFFIPFICILYTFGACKKNQPVVVDYHKYHAEIIQAEELISLEKYKEALLQYENLFNQYDFIFLRDYKIAMQISFHIGEKEKGLDYLKKAFSNGLEWKNFKKQKFFEPHLSINDLKNLEIQYQDLHHQFLNRMDTTIKSKVESMIEKDQKIAYQAYIIEDEKEQEKFISENFPPHSEEQLKDLIEIIEKNGYPGEFLIGNDFWVSTILSHHNSQGTEYVRKDTLYDFIKPTLLQNLKKGYISPYEIALVEDWKYTVISDWNESPYGYLNPPNESNIAQINKTRKAIGIRSVELRNRLVDIEEKTGMSFYLPDWVDGKIKIEN